MSNELINDLNKLPSKIKELKEKRYNTILEKNIVLDNLAYQEANIKEEILNEIDENGKKKYPNETSRKTEFEQRSKIEERYSQYIDKLLILDKSITLDNIQLEYLEDTQRNIRSILNYKANE